MKYLNLKSFLFGSCCLFSINSQANDKPFASSWLYCMNSNISFAQKTVDNHWGAVWKYARPDHSESLTTPYKSFVFKAEETGLSNGGVYLNARSYYEYKGHEYAVADYDFKNETEANQFCTALIDKCKQDYQNFGSVGFGGSGWNWRGIRAEYPNGGVNCETRFPTSNDRPQITGLLD